MKSLTRVLSAVACAACTHVPAHVATVAPAPEIEAAADYIASMRGSYSAVVRRERAAKAENDVVRVNCVRVGAARIAELVKRADRTLADLDIAIRSREPPEVVQSQLKQIALAKEMVDRSRTDAETCTSLTVTGATWEKGAEMELPLRE